MRLLDPISLLFSKLTASLGTTKSALATVSRQQRRARQRHTAKLVKQSARLSERIGHRIARWLGNERVPAWIREAKAKQLREKGWKI